MKLLLTNDDGIQAAGLAALEAVFSGWAEQLTVVAPVEEQSGTSHAVSLRKPLYIVASGPGRHGVTGTPADAANLGVNHILKDSRPDLVISGINRGANLGCDVHYSGTAGAAREACLLGLPAIAVSLAGDVGDRPDFGFAARFTRRLVELIQPLSLPPRVFLNVNVPYLAPKKIKGVKITTHGVREYDNVVLVGRDERGHPTYAFGGVPEGGVPIPDSDIVAVGAGYISITPLRLDLTSERALEWLQTNLNHGRSMIDDL